MTKIKIARSAVPVLLVFAGLTLAACETTGSTHSEMPLAAAAKPDKPPTHAEVAATCWMSVEKGYKDASLDKRADFVTKCIDQKMKAAGQPATAQKQAEPKPKT